ncbi:MAG TPA: hypothetical protein VFM45_12320, partial [Anaeromyxobacteraceae bacterium]|nr:hypothetical protein [Anaeromyxobacteraceae bacterium]
MTNGKGLTRRGLGKVLLASGAAALVSPSALLNGAETKPAAPARRPLDRRQKKALAKALADTQKTLQKLRASELDESVAPAFAIA